MLNVEPSLRPGNNLKSIKQLKLHPFFTGIDFKEISDENYKGVINKLNSKIMMAI